MVPLANYIQIGDMLVAEWFFYPLLIVFGIISLVVVWWFYTSRLKIGYRAVLTELMMGVPVEVTSSDGVVETKLLGGVRKIIARREFHVGDKTVTVKGVPCKIDMTKPAYMDYGWTNFYYDKKNGDILTFGGIYQALNPDDADIFLADNLISRFIHGIKDSPKDVLLFALVALMVGGMMFALGILVSPYVLPVSNSSSTTVFTSGVALFA